MLKEPKSSKEQSFLFAGICSVFALLLVWCCAVFPAKDWIVDLFGKSNLISLAIGTVAALFLCIVLNRVAERYRAVSVKMLPRWAAFGIIAVFACFLIASMNLEPENFSNMTNTMFLFRYSTFYRVFIVLFLCGIFLFCLKNTPFFQVKATRQNHILFISICLLLFVLLLAAKYLPNVLNESGTLYHFHAYFNSIYNVVHGVPFSPEVTSIYGHYAFFYAPFIWAAKAVGFTNEVKLTVIILAFLCAAVVLLYAYAVSKFVQNPLVQILCVVSASLITLSIDIGLYVQMQPHRTFLYAVLAAMIAFWHAHPNLHKKLCAVGYVICALGIIWSTECGIICALVWAALYCCDALQSKKFSAWLVVVFHIVCVGLCFVAALAATNLLNLLMGGGIISFSDFLFPLLTDSYMSGFLEEPLYAGPAAWISILLVLFFFVCRGLASTVLCTCAPCKNRDETVYFALGVLGIGTISYAFNRPAHGNFFIMMPLMSLLMAMIVQHTFAECSAFLDSCSRKKQSFLQTFRGCMGIVTLCVLFLTATFCVTNYGSRQDRNLRFKDEYSMLCMSNVVLNELPQDIETVAMGRGAVEIFGALGKDTGVYVMDYSDITIDMQDFIYADQQLSTLEGKALLICEDNMDLHETQNLEGYRSFMQTHTLAGRIVPPSEVDELVFEYYVPNGVEFTTDDIIVTL